MPPAVATPDQLQTLFDVPAGTEIRDQDRQFTVEQLDAGEVAFPSGRVAVCDPLVGDGDMFVTVRLGAVGRARALALRLAPDHRRVAALALDLAPGPVAAWRMWVPDGRELEAGSIWGFGSEHVVLDGLGPAQRISCSGWGDGTYATYVGTDAEGLVGSLDDLLRHPQRRLHAVKVG